MSLQRTIIACVESMEQIGPAELSLIGIADAISAEGATTAAVDVGEFGGKAK